MTTAWFCPACGDRIIRPYGRYPPLDTAASHARDGQWHARTLKPGEEPGRNEKRYALHAGSCRGVQTMLPVTDLDAYRNGIQTVTPAKRRRRRRT